MFLDWMVAAAGILVGLVLGAFLIPIALFVMVMVAAIAMGIVVMIFLLILNAIVCLIDMMDR